MLNRRNFILALTALIFLLGPSVKAQEQQPNPKLKALMALPYLQGYVKAPEHTNVTVYNRGLTDKGYSLYSSGHGGSATLIDMKGHVLHEWSYDIKNIWPNKSMKETAPFWENIYLYPNGDLLAIYHNGGMIKIDKDSQLLWSYECNAHHDIDVDDEGKIYTLTNDWMKLKDGVLVIDNAILILSPDGKLIKKISFLPLMHKSQNPNVETLLKRVVGVALAGTQDIYHSNTIQVLDGKSATQQPLIYKKGNILVSILTLSTIAIINPTLEDIIWIGGPRLWMDGQHNTTLLDNGNMLTFDNHYQGKKNQSRVLEFNPFSKKVLWEYTEKKFYTDTHGSQQRLANGNTLIIETNQGRAFEVTSEGKIVWEFFNPHTTGEKNDLIAAIFAMYRIDPATTASWLTE
jgi:hypothetical protein